MFGKNIALIAVALLFVTACAQPKYETTGKTNPSGTDDPSNRDQKVSDCEIKFRSSHYCLSWKWEKVPTSKDFGSLVFKVYRGNIYDDTPVLADLPSQPSVMLWMQSMGHGSSPTNVSRLDIGTYRAANVFFIMPGDWEFHFQVKDGANVLDEAVVNITI